MHACVCVCMCKADGKVDLKWTRNGNTRRVFSLAGRRMESSPVDLVGFLFTILVGRFVVKALLTFSLMLVSDYCPFFLKAVPAA